VAGAYSEVIDGIVADEAVEGLPGIVTDTLLDSAEDRARVASQVLDLTVSLSG
jgi:hypothetical protein